MQRKQVKMYQQLRLNSLPKMFQPRSRMYLHIEDVTIEKAKVNTTVCFKTTKQTNGISTGEEIYH